MLELEIIALIFACFAPLTWLASMIISKKYDTIAKRHLIYLLASATFAYILTYAKFRGHESLYASLLPIQAFVVLMLFPFFYLYILTLTSDKVITGWKYYVHYVVPTFYMLSFFVLTKIMMTKTEANELTQNLLKSIKLDGFKFELGYYLYCSARLYYLLSTIFYLYLIVHQYKQYKKTASNLFSDSPSKELNWIKTISILFIAVVVINVSIHYMRNSELSTNYSLIAVSFFVFGIFFWALGMFGSKQGEIYNLSKIKNIESFKSKIKISKEDIQKYIKTKKPYLTQDISIYDFCIQFKTNRTYISSVINNEFGMNFKSLINSYRIDEAKKIIHDSASKKQNISFEQIATDVGFMSYGSFLRVFKNREGVTPTEFHKTLINN